MRYLIGEFEVDLDTHELRRADQVLPIQRRVFNVLRHLVEQRSRVVTKDELLEVCWPGEVVSESAVVWSVSQVRKTLGQTGVETPIRTLRAVGYRFVGDVTEADATVSAVPAAPPAAVRRVTPAPPPGPNDPEAFVGREPVIATLGAALERAGVGNGSLCLITGDAGIGKTRCMTELGRIADAAGTPILRARCADTGAAPPFWVWTQVLRVAVDAFPEGSSRRAEVEELLGLVNPRADGDDGAATVTPFVIVDGIAQVLRALCADGPQLLLIEDLQWADDPSLDVLAFVAAELEHMRLCIVASRRDLHGEEAPPRARATSRINRIGEQVALPGLTRDEVQRYASILSGSRVSGPVATAIQLQTDGNPLFVGETVRWIVATYGAEVLSASVSPKLTLPEGAREVLRGRLDGLEPEVLELLELASAIGRRFTQRLLAQITGYSSAQLLSQLDLAIARGLVQRRDREGRYEFVHSMVLEVVYDGLSATSRVAHHLAIAEALEELEPLEPPLEQLALHFHRALATGGVADRAYRYAIAAAARAAKVLAFVEASRFQGWAVDAQRALPDATPRERATLWRDLALTQRLGGDIGRARDTLSRRLIPLAGEHGFGDMLVDAGTMMRPTSASGATGADELARAAIERGMALLGEGDLEVRVRAMSCLAYMPPISLDMPRSKALAAEAEQLARSMDSDDAMLQALRAQMYTRSGPDDHDRLIEVTEQVLRLDAKQPFPWSAADAHHTRYLAFLRRGDMEQAQRSLRAMEEVSTSRRSQEGRWSCARLRAQQLLDEGDFDAAERRFSELRDEGRQMGLDYSQAIFALQRVLLARARNGARSFTREETELSRRAAEWGDLPTYQAALGVFRLGRGNWQDARRALVNLSERGFAPVPRNLNYVITLSLLSGIAHGVGDTARAEELYALLSPYGDHNAVDGTAHGAGSASHYLGLLASALDRRPAAIRHLDDAVEHNRQMGLIPASVYSQTALAKELSVHGDEAGARHHYEEAVGHARRLGMHAVVSAITRRDVPVN